MQSFLRLIKPAKGTHAIAWGHRKQKKRRPVNTIDNENEHKNKKINQENEKRRANFFYKFKSEKKGATRGF